MLSLPFQGIGPGVECVGHLEQEPFQVLTGKLLRHLPQTQGARTELRRVEESFGIDRFLARRVSLPPASEILLLARETLAQRPERRTVT
jgi:hypothetical protein